MNDLINTIIEANKNLQDSTKANNYEMVGKDISKLQQLIEQLEKMQEENKQNKSESINSAVILNNVVE